MASTTDEPRPPTESPSDAKVDPGDSTDQLPSPETQQKVANYPVLDRHGKTHTFRDLYSGPDATPRTLIIFIRHFFCGNCQEYIHALTESITPASLSAVPIPTSLVIIGSGDPALIDAYATETACPFPIYADPTRKLYDDLGMVMTLAMGPRPEYIQKGAVQNMFESIWQGLKQIPSGLALKSGDSRQNGGEFLFESQGEGGERGVTWCHRMRTTRDHAEVAELVRVLNGGVGGKGS